MMLNLCVIPKTTREMYNKRKERCFSTRSSQGHRNTQRLMFMFVDMAGGPLQENVAGKSRNSKSICAKRWAILKNSQGF